MKYYMFGASSIGASFDGELPEGAVEISEDIYNSPDGYDVKNGKLIVPSEEKIKEFENAAIGFENEVAAKEEYSKTSERISSISDKVEDGDYSSEEEKGVLLASLSQLRSYRTEVRAYINSGNFLQPFKNKETE